MKPPYVFVRPVYADHGPHPARRRRRRTSVRRARPRPYQSRGRLACAPWSGPTPRGDTARADVAQPRVAAGRLRRHLGRRAGARRRAGELDSAPAWLWAEMVLGLASFVLVVLRRRAPVTVAVVVALMSTVLRHRGRAGDAGGRLGRHAPRRVVGRRGRDRPTSRPRRRTRSSPPSSCATRLARRPRQRRRHRRDDGLGRLPRLAPRAAVDAARSAPSGPRPSRSCGSPRPAATERARIAREMHDVLAHRISQVSMHAGALAFREDLDADELRDGRARSRPRPTRRSHDLRGVLGRAARRQPASPWTARSRRTPTSRTWSPRPARSGMNVDLRRPGRPGRGSRCPTRPGARSTASSRRG